MKFSFFPTFLLALTFGAFSLTSCEDDNPPPVTPPAEFGEVDFEFENVVGADPLVLGTGSYTNAHGDAFTVSMFKYYLSNFTLTKADGSKFLVPESYFLLNQADEASHHITLEKIPAGDYTSITFTIGVDSARNMAGAQTGALDVSNNMFWDWNSGYVFLKMEGTSPQAPSNALVFHVGGFKSPNNNVRVISPALPTGTVLKIRPERTPEIHLQADVLKLFTGPTMVNFATTPNTGHGASPTAKALANNYAAGMFKVDHVHAN